MQLADDDGRVLDAEYLVEADGDHLALIMESRSGSSSSRAPRNPDYNRALTALLTRLGQLDGVLVDALADSRHTQDLMRERSMAVLFDQFQIEEAQPRSAFQQLPCHCHPILDCKRHIEIQMGRRQRQ